MIMVEKFLNFWQYLSAFVRAWQLNPVNMLDDDTIYTEADSQLTVAAVTAFFWNTRDTYGYCTYNLGLVTRSLQQLEQ